MNIQFLFLLMLIYYYIDYECFMRYAGGLDFSE